MGSFVIQCFTFIDSLLDFEPSGFGQLSLNILLLINKKPDFGQ